MTGDKFAAAGGSPARRRRVRSFAFAVCVGALAFGSGAGALGVGVAFTPPDDAVLLSILYSNLGVGTPEELEQAFSLNTPEAEIAECMSSEGFEYEPGPDLPADPLASLEPAEFAAQYGFGIASQELGLLSAPIDPNFAYINSLSEGQRDAYYATFNECRGWVPGNDRDRYFNALTVAIEEVRGSIETSDPVVEALAVWRSCMASAGYEYESPMAMRESLYAELGSDSPDLEGLLEREIAIAVANVPCEADYKATYRGAVTDRFDEFKVLLDSALESGAAPDAQG